MEFIVLTTLSGKIYVNPRHIVSVCNSSNEGLEASVFTAESDEPFKVKETCEEIMATICELQKEGD